MIMTGYRTTLYRLIFSLAAIYNVAFGLWACLWPRAFFNSMEMFGVLGLGRKESLRFTSVSDVYEELDHHERLYRRIR